MAMFLVCCGGAVVESTPDKGRAIAVAYRMSGSVWRVKRVCEPVPNLLPATPLNPVTTAETLQATG